MCFSEAYTESPVLREWLERFGIRVRGDAEVYAVYGRDRDVLRALREVDRVVVGVSPPGVDARLAAFELRELSNLSGVECEVVEVLRLSAETPHGSVVGVNEIAVFPERPATFLRYSLYVDGVFRFNDLSDGVLVATPLGSTAYAYSAGGPVVDLRASVLEVVPVSSAMARRALVLPQSALVEIRDVVSRESVAVIADGAAQVRAGSYVAVRGAGRGRLMMRVGRAPAALRLTPTAQLVRKLLAERGPLTVYEIAELAGISTRSARAVLKKLREAGAVKALPDPTNPKRKLYFLT